MGRAITLEYLHNVELVMVVLDITPHQVAGEEVRAILYNRVIGSVGDLLVNSWDAFFFNFLKLFFNISLSLFS
jgi:hypothetical protein